ncbi:MAG: type II toxin-antitoxin system RelE/ParE family toxin [Dysgonamonadaceae bacterium]|jgi:addiction module RelE/StbE family toxin|nr:type II toxin-antitoxin system RelE/ParE family toxin [Dysgonamonadaceae bacterium]MDD3355339.1 type II toxin-antitoxin system RelE/ParE family toxin [Dysgonamonadaceae bacterium]MDD4605265.1 type II toxin-antitoxin system RelE/ParE family toxin [Dysgonamonadaceae bacterium]HUI33637.1 type II toxin-antitoxin system RelE/ParE family toxin [Dysgonamonadaceae bacterium]
MVRINWTFQAKGDLKNIAEYISKDSKLYAKLQITRLKTRTRILKTQPRSGKIVPEINIDNIRELTEGSYRIIYKIVENNQIDILTIHHSARDLTRRKTE